MYPEGVRHLAGEVAVTSDVQDGQTSTRGPTDAVRAALGRVLLSVARAWAGVPSGPLGWVSTRTVFPLTSGTLYRTMAEALDLQPDDEVLDVGCGSGAFLVQHAGQVRRVAGIDLSDIQIDLARRHLADRIAAGTADIVRGDASVLPWPDASFTAVTCMAAFEVFPDPAQVLAEVFRVLRPGGRAVMTIGERVPAGTQTERRWGAIWVWSEDDVVRMLERAGFTDVTLRYAPSWGNDPVSKALVRVWDRFGVDMRDLRLVSARKE
jgi:SAM-dependent methyltransferase